VPVSKFDAAVHALGLCLFVVLVGLFWHYSRSHKASSTPQYTHLVCVCTYDMLATENTFYREHIVSAVYAAVHALGLCLFVFSSQKSAPYYIYDTHLRIVVRWRSPSLLHGVREPGGVILTASFQDVLHLQPANFWVHFVRNNQTNTMHSKFCWL